MIRGTVSLQRSAPSQSLASQLQRPLQDATYRFSSLLQATLPAPNRRPKIAGNIGCNSKRRFFSLSFESLRVLMARIYDRQEDSPGCIQYNHQHSLRGPPIHTSDGGITFEAVITVHPPSLSSLTIYMSPGKNSRRPSSPLSQRGYGEALAFPKVIARCPPKREKDRLVSDSSCRRRSPHLEQINFLVRK